MSTNPILDEILASIERLPEVPSVALQVNALLDKPDTDAQDLAEVILLDPILTAQILRLCNSAEYGFARQIATIREAIAILGHKVLKRIVYTIIAHGFLNRPVNGYGLEQGALWENSITCGAYARFLANELRFKDPELALIAGLLRDIGKIAMETYLAEKTTTVETTAVEEKCSFHEAEEKIIGVSHTTVGASLATQWNLPEPLIHAIAHHHQPSALPKNVVSPNKYLVCLVHLADSYTMMTGTGVGVDGLMYALDPAVYETLNIKSDSSELELWYANLLDLREEIATMSATLTTP